MWRSSRGNYLRFWLWLYAAPLALTDIGADAQTNTASGQDSSEDDDGIVIESDDEEESDNEKLRLTSYFQRSSSSASGQDAKAKAVAGKEAKKAAVKGKGKVKATAAADRPDAAAATAQGNASDVSAKDKLNAIDGRVERIAKIAKEQLANSNDVLLTVCFDEDFDGLTLAGEGEKAFVQALNAKATILKNEKKPSRTRF